jgi:hypothetical protein
MSNLANMLSKVVVGSPQQHGNMSVYPLSVPNGHQRSYHTLDEALRSNTFEIKEVSDSGSVPILMVSNTGTLPVLLVIGEELIGAKQNRVLNTSLLVPAGKEMPIPVSCVEAGRWDYRTASFGSGDSTSHFFLRKTQTENVTRSLRTKPAPDAQTEQSPQQAVRNALRFDAQQGEVWAEVSRKMAAHSASSDTSALHDVYDQTGPLVTEYLEKFTPPQAEGILVAIGGQIMGVDLFDHHDTLKVLWSKLMRGYALDAVERKSSPQAQATDDTKPITAEQITSFFEAAQASESEVYEAVGMGKDVRMSAQRVSGSSLLWEDRPIHTSLFNAEVSHRG